MRETCICEQPTRSAISDCSRSSWKRRRRISRARSSRIAGQALERDAGLDAVELDVVGADQVAGGGRVVLLVVHGRVERAHRAALGGLQRLDDLLRLRGRGARRGRRPWASGRARPRASRAPPRRRGRAPAGRAPAARPTWSRGSSGAARRGSSARRRTRTRGRGPGSQRSTAFTSPTEATWIEVVERLGGAAVAQREAAGERHVALDQLVARARVAGA